MFKLAALFRRRPSLPVVSLPKQVQPALFKQTPPWWARWALVLVALDVMVATSAIELTWNCWTVAPDQKKDISNGAVPESGADKPVMQPVWKRGAWCFVHFMSGCVVAGSILAARSRVVRSISFSPLSANSRAGRKLYLETAGHPQNHGYEIPLKRCQLTEWKKKQLALGVRDHGKWFLELRGASINGTTSLSPSLNHTYMVTFWKKNRQRPSDNPSTSKIPKRKKLI